MEKEVMIRKAKNLVLKIISDVISILCLFGLFTILEFHKAMPFFPVLFLFDFCFVIGYPLFLRYILKRKWFECTKDDYLELKYIFLPWLIMEGIVMIYYYPIIRLAIDAFMESNG